MTLVSIIVPIYNAEKYLAESLECLINQTYKNIEIICINDGSTDNSLKILEEYTRKDSRIKIYSQENRGEAETRNRGVTLATGEYITALDSDDVCSLNTIETSINKIKENNADIVINFLNARLNLKDKKPKDFSYTTVWQLVIKKELLDKNPDIIYNKNLKMGPDSVFTHKILGLTDKIVINPDSSILYRIHDNQISQRIENQPDKLLKNIQIWFDDLTDFYTKKNWWESHNDHFMNYLCEQPFTSYLRANFNKLQKEELFNLIHNTVKEYELKFNFNYSNNRVKMFRKFLSCKSYKEFEFYWWISHIYVKYTNLKKIIINKRS